MYIKFFRRLIISIAGDVVFFLRYDLRRRLISESLSQYLEYKKYPHYFTVGAAIQYCLDDAQLYCKGRGIDIGSGSYPFPGARPIEQSPHEDALNICEIDSSLQFVFSSHCLEHIPKEQWPLFFGECFRVLQPGGILYLYLPARASMFWSETNMTAHASVPRSLDVYQIAEYSGFHLLTSSTLPDIYCSTRHVFVKRQ
ncbi:class I SAM-dependent methyltransferase [Synechococcus sp. BS56D]|uniref:methyltransferase domain-containing protein n=1 Tax=Synechococcus sp. BS56D TaxID=2055944 RepID=UPI0013871838